MVTNTLDMFMFVNMIPLLKVQLDVDDKTCPKHVLLWQNLSQLTDLGRQKDSAWQQILSEAKLPVDPWFSPVVSEHHSHLYHKRNRYRIPEIWKLLMCCPIIHLLHFSLNLFFGCDLFLELYSPSLSIHTWRWIIDNTTVIIFLKCPFPSFLSFFSIKINTCKTGIKKQNKQQKKRKQGMWKSARTPTCALYQSIKQMKGKERLP